MDDFYEFISCDFILIKEKELKKKSFLFIFEWFALCYRSNKALKHHSKDSQNIMNKKQIGEICSLLRS